jgi:ADP-ribosyl-[dinitrogen reductase] hydrolase
MATADRQQRINQARLGMFIGDALAMPVHWYYDTWALRMEYGEITDFLAPHNPHRDSILWRSSYTPTSPKAEILHDQARYWGQRGIHYHQFLLAGENTLNLQLARQLMVLLKNGEYSQDRWLQTIIDFMTSPGRHRDTYVEEYLRHFFTGYGQNIPPAQCGRNDEKHIGGLSLMLPLLLVADPPDLETALDHLTLTHGGPFMRSGAGLVARVLFDLLDGRPLTEAILERCADSGLDYADHEYHQLAPFPDQKVIGRHFSSACYLDHAIPAMFYLAVKYQEHPETAMQVNTMCGGDNCGRGAVLGALLGAAASDQCWPQRWRERLVAPPPLLIGHHG